MQTLTYVLYQLDEAMRYIDGGRLEQLRLALVLLDNAAELQLDRRCRDERQSEDLRERIRTQAITMGAVAHSPELAELAAGNRSAQPTRSASTDSSTPSSST